MLDHDRPTRLDPAALVPLILIAMFLLVWGGCGANEFEEKLPGGYSIMSLGSADGQLFDRDRNWLIGGRDGPGVLKRRVEGDLVFGSLDDGNRFVLDTRTEEFQSYNSQARWRDELRSRGVTSFFLRRPGPFALPGREMLAAAMLIAVALVFAIIGEMGAARRRRLARLLIENTNGVTPGPGPRRARRCPRCGYDMMGVANRVCPECGLDQAGFASRTLRPPCHSTATRAKLIAIGLLPSLLLLLHMNRGRPSLLFGELHEGDALLFLIPTVPGVALWYLLLRACDRSGRVFWYERGPFLLLLGAWLWPVTYLTLRAMQ